MKKRIMVVDDSAFMRRVISDIINSVKNFEVVGTAKNGKEALDLIPVLNPDCITLDIEMPVMDGITALEEIVEKYDVPVIMCSTLTKEGAEQTIKTLELGAFDFITKPTIANVDKDNLKSNLIERLIEATNAPRRTLRTKLRKPILNTKKVETRFINNRFISSKGKINKVVAIGISTGGPKALHEIIPDIPKNFPAPILIVQHMPKGFIAPMASRLSEISNIIVKEAEDNEILKNSVCYIAPGGQHMKIENNMGNLRIKLNQEPPVGGHRPAANVMFESLCDIPNPVIGVIMTGMGSDGTSGLKSLKSKKRSCKIIAQDEQTSIVFGMPKAAINAGIVDVVAPLNNIVKEMCKCLEE